MFYRMARIWGIGLVFILLAAACSQAVPTEDSRLNDLEAKVNTLSNLQAEVNDLQSKVNDLQAQLDASGMMTQDTHSDDLFAVSMAQYVLDTAGFHTMAETLAETQQIDPAYLGTVNRAQKILANVSWPESLLEQEQAFESLLGDFATALEADDAESAVQYSDEVHDSQHELSHAIDAWLGSTEDHEH